MLVFSKIKVFLIGLIKKVLMSDIFVGCFSQTIWTIIIPQTNVVCSMKWIAQEMR